MTDGSAVLVTGATGNTGRRVLSRLAARGATVKAASRHPAGHIGVRGVEGIRFDWHGPATFGDALRNVNRIYLVPPPRDPDPAAVMLPFLEHAAAVGVRRVVLLSSSPVPAGGPGTGLVHQALPGLFDEWAVLRPSWFMQNFTGDHPHAHGIRADGVIVTATGTGRVGFVDADDIADVAVHALTDGTAPGGDLMITGPGALSYDEVAAIISEVTGRPVTHRPVTPGQLRDRLAAIMPPDFAAILAELDRAIAAGAEDRVTATVENLTGHPARGFRAHLESHEAGRRHGGVSVGRRSRPQGPSTRRAAGRG